MAACASTAEPESHGAHAAPVQLVYWKSLSGARHDAQVTLVERFHSSQSRARVSVEHAGEYNVLSERLRIALATGTPPDVVMLGTNADLPAFGRAGALEPLEPLAGADGSFRLDDLTPGFVRDSRVDGALLQLPFARSVPLLVANADHLRAAGLPETPPATWEALTDVGRGLMRQHGVEDRPRTYAALGSGTGWWEFQPLLWAHGGAFSDDRRRVLIDAPPSVAAARLLADLVHRHRIATATKAMLPDFQRGALSLLVTSSANLTQLLEPAGGALFEVRIGPIPSLDGRSATPVPGGGAGLSLLRGIAEPRRAAGWAFLRHMTSAESSASFARATGYTPIRPDALRDPRLADFYARVPAARLPLDLAQRVRPADAVLATPHVNRRIEEALDALLFGGESPQVVCASLAAVLRGLVEASSL